MKLNSFFILLTLILFAFLTGCTSQANLGTDQKENPPRVSNFNDKFNPQSTNTEGNLQALDEEFTNQNPDDDFPDLKEEDLGI